MKSRSLLVLALLAAPAVARADTIDMGKWSCSGSSVKKVSVKPGAHDYVWHGSCGGAEGYDVVVTPRGHLIIKEDDQQAGEIVLHVENRGKVTRKVKMHVFVGFA